jgi:hypothetical protein
MSKRPAISEEFLWAIFHGDGKWHPAILGAQLGEEDKFHVKFVGYEKDPWQITADKDIEYRMPLTSVLHDEYRLDNRMENCNNDDQQEDRSDRSADSEEMTAKKRKGSFKQDDAAGGSKSAPTLVGAAVGVARAVGRWVGISATADGAGEGEAGELCETDVSRAFNTKVEPSTINIYLGIICSTLSDSAKTSCLAAMLSEEDSVRIISCFAGEQGKWNTTSGQFDGVPLWDVVAEEMMVVMEVGSGVHVNLHTYLHTYLQTYMHA